MSDIATAVLLLLGGTAAMAALEGALLWGRPWFYFALAFPLDVEPLPLDRMPEGEGRTASARYEIAEERARFWTWGTARGLAGLHGAVVLVRHRGRVHLLARWAPPWTLIFAIVGLCVLVGVHGVAVVGAVAAVVLLVTVWVAYRDAAIGAVAELRFRWASGDDEPDRTP